MLLSATSFTQINYNLRMSKPQNHYFEVEMEIQGIADKTVEIKMPVWAPGSYLVRDFSKNVNLIKAFNEKGESLIVEKTNKNTWKINKGNAKKVKVNYEVYSFELTVRTSFLDLSHGFVSGTGMFMYVEKLRNKAGKLTVFPHSNFKTITTALSKNTDGFANDGSQVFSYSDYDQLVDCPIEIGNQEVFEFQSKGVNHTVAMYGEGNYNIEQLKIDMAKITAASTEVFGQNPNKEYVFIVHNVTDSQGGLEHVNSTTLSVNRWGYSPDKYKRFLTLVAHEYFHLWNVKRMRAIELGPFNYDEETYTSLLWVMEGFTSYYEDLIMYRAGFFSKEEYLSTLSSTLNYVEGSEGSRVQPVAHASFDAWIKAYKPNENSANTTMSYYSRGGLVAAVMDAKIVAKFNGKKSLDGFIQLLYQEFFVKLDRGFSAQEFEKMFSKYMEEDMSAFFQKYVYDTQIPDYKSIFEPLGISVEENNKELVSFGASFTTTDGKVTVRAIRSNSAAEDAGLSVGDEVIGFNGYRMNATLLNEMVAEIAVNQTFNLLVARDLQLFELTPKMGTYFKRAYTVSFSPDFEKSSNGKYFLRR